MDNAVIEAAVREPATARQSTRERILQTAEELFLEKGYRRTSVHEIAAAAGYTTGAIYSNFSGKDAVFVGVLQRRTTKDLGNFRRIALELIHEGLAPGSAIAIALARVAGGPAWDRLVYEFLGRALADDGLREETAEAFRAVTDSVRDVLRAAGAKPILSIERVAAVVTAMIEGHLMLLDVDPGACDYDSFSDALSLLLKEEPA